MGDSKIVNELVIRDAVCLTVSLGQGSGLMPIRLLAHLLDDRQNGLRVPTIMRAIAAASATGDTRFNLQPIALP